MSVWQKIRGTAETLWQIGLGGPNLKNNAGVVEARNSGDSAFAVVRGAIPVGDNDLVTKAYADQLASRYIVTAQISGASALPSNTSTEHFIVVTTSGGTATIGQLIWDDGSNTGTAQLVSALAGNMIAVTTALSGGTITLSADTLYIWDSGSTTWVSVAGVSLSGAIREIRYTLNNAASQSSATVIPANAIIVEAMLDITTPYSGGATISVGQTGTTALLMATTDNLATVNGVYATPQDTSWGGSALAVLTTVAGAPAAGAGKCIVKYCVPDA